MRPDDDRHRIESAGKADLSEPPNGGGSPQAHQRLRKAAEAARFSAREKKRCGRHPEEEGLLAASHVSGIS